MECGGDRFKCIEGSLSLVCMSVHNSSICVHRDCMSVTLPNCVYRDLSETVCARVSLNACLEAFSSDAYIDDFYSSALQARTVAKKYVVCLSLIIIN